MFGQMDIQANTKTNTFSHFKLQEHHVLQIQWNYFATSHGKGPNDALGVNVKRMAHRLTMARTVIVNNTETLATAVRSCNTNIHVHVIDEAAIQQKCQDIGTEDLWNGLQTFQGTITTHFLKPLDKYTIQLKFHTSADEYRNVTVCHNLENPVTGPRVTAANQVRPQPVAGLSSVKNSETPKSLNAKPAPKHPKIRKEPDDANSNDVCGYCGHYYGFVSDPKSTDEWIVCQQCRIWVHESCGEDWGVIDDDERYTCLPRL